ncbi:hypothetical protein [Streptomyces sp. NPDC058861]|uniref:hypothetical protein n=1 Tax=Streptomyces sp. NPDC058861 TaxID=3346653 RepID=UPI003680BCF4
MPVRPLCSDLCSGRTAGLPTAALMDVIGSAAKADRAARLAAGSRHRARVPARPSSRRSGSGAGRR